MLPAATAKRPTISPAWRTLPFGGAMSTTSLSAMRVVTSRCPISRTSNTISGASLPNRPGSTHFASSTRCIVSLIANVFCRNSATSCTPTLNSSSSWTTSRGAKTIADSRHRSQPFHTSHTRHLRHECPLLRKTNSVPSSNLSDLQCWTSHRLFTPTRIIYWQADFSPFFVISIWQA